eukprot:Hpha_TRINITY_DN22654_c0_g1::TRINITY_DN22654_c0_g1_i1::g.192792::m.192792
MRRSARPVAKTLQRQLRLDSSLPTWAVPYKSVFFLGGNGIPPGAYARFLSHLGDRLKLPVHTMELHKHMAPGPDGTRPASWAPMLVAAAKCVTELRKEGPVLGIGHSLGGALMLGLTSGRDIAENGNFVVGRALRHVVVIDPPLFRPSTRAFLRFSKNYNIGPFHSLIEKVKGRRDVWPDREAAFEHLRKTRPWVGCDSSSIEDFCEYCLEDTDEGVRLAFPKDTEAHIFATTPGDLHLPLRRPAVSDVGLYPPGRSPTTLLNNMLWMDGSLLAVRNVARTAEGGTYLWSTRHEFSRPTDLEWLQKQYGYWMNFHPLGTDFGHFFPLEDPIAAANLILQCTVPHMAEGEMSREKFKVSESTA